MQKAARGNRQQRGEMQADAGRNLAEQQRPDQAHRVGQRQPGGHRLHQPGNWSGGKNTPHRSTMGVMNSVK
jgi:hypothetical protein